jgi:hypothetical protein
MHAWQHNPPCFLRSEKIASKQAIAHACRNARTCFDEGAPADKWWDDYRALSQSKILPIALSAMAELKRLIGHRYAGTRIKGGNLRQQSLEHPKTGKRSHQIACQPCHGQMPVRVPRQ